MTFNSRTGWLKSLFVEIGIPREKPETGMRTPFAAGLRVAWREEST